MKLKRKEVEKMEGLYVSKLGKRKHVFTINIHLLYHSQQIYTYIYINIYPRDVHLGKDFEEKEKYEREECFRGGGDSKDGVLAIQKKVTPPLNTFKIFKDQLKIKQPSFSIISF